MGDRIVQNHAQCGRRNQKYDISLMNFGWISNQASRCKTIYSYNLLQLIVQIVLHIIAIRKSLVASIDTAIPMYNTRNI